MPRGFVKRERAGVLVPVAESLARKEVFEAWAVDGVSTIPEP
jgi:hypothetical protein